MPAVGTFSGTRERGYVGEIFDTWDPFQPAARCPLPVRAALSPTKGYDLRPDPIKAMRRAAGQQGEPGVGIVGTHHLSRGPRSPRL